MDELILGVDTAALPPEIDSPITIQEDGSALIEIEVEVAAAHGDNLAEFLEESELSQIAEELLDGYAADLESRSDWEDTYKEGLEILGLKLEDTEDPFPGACAAHHPLMLEAALQFQARAIGELFPAGGPVKTSTVGDVSAQVMQQAERVREFMNYQVTEEMEEYFDELDTMLFNLPLAGSAFKKVYYDFTLARPVSKFVPAEQFVVSYGTTDLAGSSRYTHVLQMDGNDVRKAQVGGFYRDIDLSPAPRDPDEIQDAKDDISGLKPSALLSGSRKLLEIHADLDIPGYEDLGLDGEPTGIKLPYIVTIDYASGEVLSIRRNWEEGDPLRKKVSWFVHYKFLPGLGFYGLGLPHILGNLQKTATATMRALIDAGQFANLPAGFKARGMRINGGDTPLAFGEFRDVEGYGDDIRKSIIPIPVKEPSQTLFLLMGRVVDDARRLAAVADMNATDMNKEAPVGTTLAIMEQGIKVMSAIHKRLHRAQRSEFKILARINRDYLPPEYPYAVEGGMRMVFKQDFDNRVDILPVSDPNIFSEAQRIMRAQTQLQLAQQFPQQHDLKAALRRMHEVIGTQKIEEVLLPERGPQPMDPATEFYAVLTGQPIKAYAYQDHQSHITAHQAQMMQLQVMAQQNPALQQAMPLLMSHMAEHQGFLVRQQIEAMTGIPLPPAPEVDPANPAKQSEYVQLGPDLENQIAQRQAIATQQLAQQQMQLAQVQRNQQLMQDPSMQVMMGKVQADQMDAQAKLAKVQADQQVAMAKLTQSAQEHQDDMALEVAKLQQKGQLDRERMAADMRTVMLNKADPTL